MIPQNHLGDLDYVSSHEWLETNGLGGFASGTIGGMATRRYHGLLVAAVEPPADRMVVVSRFEESVEVESAEIFFSSNQYPGTVYPEGYKCIREFVRNEFPVWRFEVGGFEIRKTIGMIQQENTTVVAYEILSGSGTCYLKLRPLYASRNYHQVAAANHYIWPDYLVEDNVFRTINYFGCPEIFIGASAGSFEEDKKWYYQFEYARELERGLEGHEDLFTHGFFKIPLKKGQKVYMVLSTEAVEARDGGKLLEKERRRRQGSETGSRTLTRLQQAAAQFLVRRENSYSVIAGYPWFTDWGRDTMISLPGLFLTTGKFREARQVIETFLGAMDGGMIPNRFREGGQKPEYNTMDATLWMFVASYLYYKKTKDIAFVKKWLGVFAACIQTHLEGTRYAIQADPEDLLLSGGCEGVQLTWMDARIGDCVFTPRVGKPVEINALWYNALRIAEFFHQEAGKGVQANKFGNASTTVLASFRQSFLRSDGLGCYDYIDSIHKNSDIRPNQLFALSLPFPLLEGSAAQAVLEVVADRLLTPAGLRSLDREAREYQGKYLGNIWERDAAYHQGTVWCYLLGPYVDALFRVRGPAARKEAEQLIQNFLDRYLDSLCIGNLPELADGDEPHLPRGTFAQAWSVGEILRVADTYSLELN